MAPMDHSTSRCPCCGLPHERLPVFATVDGKKVNLWYICPEFGQRVRVPIAVEDESKERGN